jgi:tetratricopeptide (TPR) repeat protein
MVLRRPARGACDRERTFKSRVFFEQAPGAGSEAERYRRALIPWQILIRRSPADPAVQEALLAVPYAYSRLKGREQAIEHYRSAISHYEAERRHLQRVTQMIRETPLPNVPVSMGNAPLPTWDLPRAEDLMSLGAVFASNPFQSTLRALQTLRGFTRTLAPLYARLDSMASRLGSGPAPVSETTIGEDRHSDGRTVSAHAMSDSAQDAPKAETDPDRRITYFGVFDFLPPTEIPSDLPSRPVKPTPMPDIDTDRPLAPPPARRQSRDKEDEMPLQRHAQLRMRLDKLQAQSLATQDALEKALREMALVEVAQQQVRLDTYLAQARFSLARLLDPAVASHPGD